MNRSSWVPIILFTAAAVAALVFRDDLIAWFSGRKHTTPTTSVPSAPLPDPAAKPDALALPAV